MKGLIYRDFYLGKKTFLLYTILALATGLFGVLMSLSSRCGNLISFAQNSPGEFGIVMDTFTYVPVILIVVSVWGIGQCIFSDYKSGWMYYSYTLPAKKSTMVGAHYIVSILVILAGVVCGIIHTYIIRSVAGFDITKKNVMGIALVGIIGVIYSMCLIPLSLASKTEKRTQTIIIIFGTVLYIVSMIQFSLLEVDDERVFKIIWADIKPVKDALIGYWWIILPLILSLSISISVRLLKKNKFD